MSRRLSLVSPQLPGPDYGARRDLARPPGVQADERFLELGTHNHTRPQSAPYVRRAIPREGPADRPKSPAAQTAAKSLGRGVSWKLQKLRNSQVDTSISAAAPRSVDSIWDLGNKAGLWVENGKLKQKIRELEAQREREERERERTLLAADAARSGLSEQHAAAWAEQERTIKLLKEEVARLKTERSRDAERIHDLQSIIRSYESKKNESKNLAKARSFAEVLEVLYMSDDELEVKFNQLADLMHRGNAVMSRQGFRKALAAFNVAMTPAESDEAFDMMDDNKDGHVDFSEFLKSTKNPTQLELVLGTQHNVIVRALASALMAEAGGSEDPLTVYLNLSMTNISAAVAKFEPFLQKIVYRHISTLKRAEEEGVSATADRDQGNDKFAFCIKGGSIDDFNAGITDRVGHPHPNLCEGMKDEHTDMGDSDIEFTTGNYSITTTPKREYELVISGGADTDLTANAFKGTGAVRVLRPLSWYGKFDETGRLITDKDGKSIVRTTPDVVVKARLRLEEVVAVILYTGPMYWIWNAVLRGKEACPPIQWTVWERCLKHRNFYSSSLHILGSAIKKIQQSGVGLKEDMMLYRGLCGGKLPEQMFKPDEHGRLGMAEFGVSSTTSSLTVAIEYSGANEGKMATVLAVRTTQVDSAACLTDFSQYPHEKEFLWLALSYVQLIKGREEIIANEHGQLVRILHVTINVNARTLTIEELEAQRKMIVVPMLNLMHTAVCQTLDIYASTEEFKKRLHLDWHADEFGPGKKRDFLQRIKDEAMERVQLFTTKPPEWFLDNHNLGHAVASGLALPKLAEDKLTLWLFDKTLQLSRFSLPTGEDYANFEAAHGFLVAGRRVVLCEALRLKDDDRVARLALEECDALGFVRTQNLTEKATFEALECVDEFSGETPLLIQCFLGHVAGVTLLLQARANPNAASLGASGGVTGNTGKPALLCVAEMGYTDVLATLLKFNANVDGTDTHGRTALHTAAKNGHVDAVKILLEWGAAKERQDHLRWRAMHQAARHGHVGVVKELMRINADVNAAGERKNTPLHYAARHGHVGVLQVLAQDTKLDLGLLNQHSQSALHVALEAREHSLKSLSADQLESKRNEDVLLRIAFDTFAHQEYPKDRMSKRLLVQALYALHFGHDEDGMDQLLRRVDCNSDGEIDFDEFRLIVYEECVRILQMPPSP